MRDDDACPPLDKAVNPESPIPASEGAPPAAPRTLPIVLNPLLDAQDEDSPSPAPAPVPAPVPATGPLPVLPTGPLPGSGQPPLLFEPVPPASRPEVPVCCWVAIGSTLTSLILAGLLFLHLRAPTPRGESPAPVPSQAPAATVPVSLVDGAHPALQPYLEQARAGDPQAMRMLGAMYYHGLNLPRNREEGLRWYREAAKAGSKVAAEEARQLQ